MKRFAFVNDNKIIKIEEHDLYESILDSHLYQTVTDITDLIKQPDIGWLWDGIKFKKDIPDVTPRQIRQALILAGVTMQEIDDAINMLPEPQKSLALVEWEYSVAFIRSNPLVESIGMILGWTEEEIDELWVMAKRL